MLSFILKDHILVSKTEFFSSQSQDSGTNLDGGKSLDQIIALINSHTESFLFVVFF